MEEGNKNRFRKMVKEGGAGRARIKVVIIAAKPRSVEVPVQGWKTTTSWFGHTARTGMQIKAYNTHFNIYHLYAHCSVNGRHPLDERKMFCLCLRDPALV